MLDEQDHHIGDVSLRQIKFSCMVSLWNDTGRILTFIEVHNKKEERGMVRCNQKPIGIIFFVGLKLFVLNFVINSQLRLSSSSRAAQAQGRPLTLLLLVN